VRFLADESCDFAVVRALRAAGHDVTAIAELRPAAEDDLVLRVAHSEDRILLTEDKDFGALVYAGGQKSPGVVLIRFPAAVRNQLGQTVERVVVEIGERLRGAFIVVEPGRARISRPPALS
jgi:predicted nuclease of predicted toxin-antitoxin system